MKAKQKGYYPTNKNQYKKYTDFVVMISDIRNFAEKFPEATFYVDNIGSLLLMGFSAKMPDGSEYSWKISIMANINYKEVCSKEEREIVYKYINMKSHGNYDYKEFEDAESEYVKVITRK